MSYKALAVNFFFCSIICYGQQLDNAGFEQWENVGSSDEEPIEWSSTKTSDNSSLNALAPQVISRTSDAHSGNYAAKLTNLNVPFVNIVANGIITNGIIHTTTNPQESYVYTDVNSSAHNQPFTAYPDSIVGWYKYAPQGNDIGNIQVLIHGSYGQLPVDASTSIIALADFDFSANSNWTRFSTPFNYYPTINNPAYILCNISAGDSTQAVANSELIIDDLELVYSTTSSMSLTKNNNLKIYYAENGIQIFNINSQMDYQLFNTNGQLIKTGLLNSSNSVIRINLENGIYLLNLKNNEQHQNIKFGVF